MAFLTTIFFAFLGICGLVGCARALRLVIRAINGIFDKFVVLLAGHRRRAEEQSALSYSLSQNRGYTRRMDCSRRSIRYRAADGYDASSEEGRLTCRRWRCGRGWKRSAIQRDAGLRVSACGERSLRRINRADRDSERAAVSGYRRKHRQHGLWRQRAGGHRGFCLPLS